MVLAGVRPASPSFAPPASEPTAEQTAFFESKVRPLLVEQCVPCHGPSAQMGGVRLDTAEGVRAVVTPGDPDGSRLLRVMHYTGKVKMPPTGKRPDAEIAALATWVRVGAHWPKVDTAKPSAAKVKAAHWAFQPVRPTAPPKVKNAVWCASPIDRFVLARLEAKGLTPAPVADRRTLIRRAYFDLIGLPPTPEEVAAFVTNKSPDAWAKVVDHLLASPHYGERWGRHWLDVARYADSNGLDENKAFGTAWRYRDWVVDALNRDEPYDQFLRDQLAGDLLDSGGDDRLRNARLTATGFLSLGAKVLAEQDKPKLVMDIVDEQIEVVSKATMGLTVACARCHDHKFDPITTKDYYALAGIFKSTKTMQNLGFVSRVNERPVPTAALLAERAAAMERVEPAEAALKTARAAADADLSVALRRDADRYLRAGWELSRQPGVLLSVAETPARPGDPPRALLEAIAFKRGNAVRDTTNYGKGLGVIITDKAPVSAEWDVDLPTEGRYQVEIRYAAEEARPVRLLVNGKAVKTDAAGGATGSWMPDGQRWEAQGVYKFLAGANRIKIERKDGPLPHISRLLIVPAPPAPVDSKNALTADEIAKRDGLIAPVLTRWASRVVGAANLDEARKRAEGDEALFAIPEKAERFYANASGEAVKKAQDALDAAKKGVPEIPAVLAVEEDPKPANCPVHVRGSTENLGDIVPRGLPAILAKGGDAPTPVGEAGSGRLTLARWLTSGSHPLTARVAVNRTWQHLFGDGLVRTPDNWGVKGEKPTHPELLDWLAATFVRDDRWSQKKLIRRLMLSSAYRMASASPQETKAQTLDPDNRLLWRMNRRRLEAEPYRDALLAVAGKLDPAMGGTLLTTPNDDYVTNDQSKDRAQYGVYRRSLYLPVIRNSLYDLYQAFDFGDGMTVNARRASTTVAPQALFALNSPLARESAEAFAASLLDGKQAGQADDADRIRRAYLRAYGRPATTVEVARCRNFLARYGTALAAYEPDASKRRLRAWQGLCQVLLAANEFLYVD
jgi:cytochrome c553